MKRNPPLQICLLEDNPERRAAMQDCLAERFYQYPTVFFDDAFKMVRHLRANLSDAILICLDHDLELIPSRNGRANDPGTGRDVANYLAVQAPRCPVVIHSTNSAAAQGMQMLLDEKGWTTFLVHPWDDLEWIGMQWIRTVRKALLQTARPEKKKTRTRTA